MEEKIALIDMDGTLFDYDGQLRRDLTKLMSPQEEIPEDIHADIPWLAARVDLIKNQPGWWANLPRFELGWDILKLLQMIGFDCHILTKGPRHRPIAWAEKVECITKHLGEDFPIDIAGKNKKWRYGRVLVDDYPKYIQDWLSHRPRGLVIMPAHDYNKSLVHPRVFRYQGAEDLPLLRSVLQAAFDRRSGDSG